MNNLPLKPLRWTQNNYAGIVTHTAKSPLHDYTIRYDDLEGAYLIDYYERMTNEHGNEFFKSVDEAKNWAQSTHYPSKMQPYIKPDSITDIANWFKAAKPEPTNTDVIAQVACHLEEVDEFIDSMDIHSDPEHLEEVRRNCKEIRNKGHSDKSIENSDHLEMLDALCDQIVTATGVAYMMGFDIEGALKEVIRSNNSKMVDGKFTFDDNGKIAKPENYSEPDLTKFVEVTK